MIGLQISGGDVTTPTDTLAQPACHRPQPAAADLQTARAGFEPETLDAANGQWVEMLLEQPQTPRFGRSCVREGIARRLVAHMPILFEP